MEEEGRRMWEVWAVCCVESGSLMTERQDAREVCGPERSRGWEGSEWRSQKPRASSSPVGEGRFLQPPFTHCPQGSAEDSTSPHADIPAAVVKHGSRFYWYSLLVFTAKCCAIPTSPRIPHQSGQRSSSRSFFLVSA